MTSPVLSAQPRCLQLPESLDLNAAAPLAIELLGLRGVPLTIDAGAVSYLGAQCLQVLLSAAATWRDDGQPLSMRDPSGSFVGRLTALGHNLSLPIQETCE